MWYNISDLRAFRDEARNTCRAMRVYHQKTDPHNNNNDNDNTMSKNNGLQSPCLSMDESTRGLEQRCCLERQRRKLVASRYILQIASDSSCEAETLAQLYRKLTSWASTLAMEEAARDFHRAWKISSGSSSSSSATTTASVVEPNPRKRSRPSADTSISRTANHDEDNDDSSSTNRRVRARTVSAF
jgi:hypothetical protein